MTGSPTGFNGSQCVKGNGFPVNFSSCVRGFFGFLHSCFSYIFPLIRERFLRFYFLCFEIRLYIFPALTLRGLGFLKDSDLWGAQEYSRTNMS